MQSFEKSAAANPKAVEPVYNLGVVLFEAGDEAKAIACFEKAVLLSKQPRPGGPAWDTRAIEFMAVIYSRRQQWDKARRVLNKALKHSRLQPRILTSLALVELKAGNTTRAIELLQETLERDAHYAPAIYNLAVINNRFLNKKDDALPLLAAYTTLVPSGPQAEEARSMIKEIKRPPTPAPKRHAQAKTEQAAKTTISKKTRPPVVTQPVIYPSFKELMQVAKILEDQGRKEAAFNNYLRIARAAEQQTRNTSVRNQAVERAIFLAGKNPKALYDLGVYFLERNKKDEAFAFFKSAAGQNTNKQIAALALAKISIEKQDYDTAIVSFKKADKIKPEDPEALWLLANLYDRSLFLTNSAASAYARFVSRFPRDRRAADARNRLNIINPENESAGGKSPAKEVGSRTFWQRMFHSSSSVTNAGQNKQSNKAGSK